MIRLHLLFFFFSMYTPLNCNPPYFDSTILFPLEFLILVDIKKLPGSAQET